MAWLKAKHKTGEIVEPILSVIILKYLIKERYRLDLFLVVLL